MRQPRCRFFPMRIIFCGTPQFSVPTLKHLLAQPDFEIAAVITQPDRPRGRGHEVFFSPVKETALAAGIPVHQPEKIRAPEVPEILQKLAPDVIVIIAYGQIIPGATPTHSKVRLDQSSRFPAPQISRRRSDQLGHRERRNEDWGHFHAHRRRHGHRRNPAAKRNGDWPFRNGSRARRSHV